MQIFSKVQLTTISEAALQFIEYTCSEQFPILACKTEIKPRMEMLGSKWITALVIVLGNEAESSNGGHEQDKIVELDGTQ